MNKVIIEGNYAYVKLPNETRMIKIDSYKVDLIKDFFIYKHFRREKVNYDTFIARCIDHTYNNSLTEIIFNQPENYFPWFIDNDGFNLTDENIRFVDKSLISFARRTDEGVSFNKKTGTWEAYINPDGKKQHLGLFSTKQKAVEARAVAREKVLEKLYERNGLI